MSETKPEICPYCKEEHVVKIGMKVTTSGKRQRYQCMECGRTFYGD